MPRLSASSFKAVASKASERIAGIFHTSKRAGGVILAVAALTVAGGAGYAVADHADPAWLAIISDDASKDCVKVAKATRKSHGQGQREIPEESCGYRVGYIATYEGPPDAIPWSSGTPQRAVYNAWKANGSVIDANGYARMGSGDDAPYIVACSLSAYGMQEGQRGFIGEQVTFYFDSGAPLTCIIGDAKGSPSMVDPNDLDQVAGKHDAFTDSDEQGVGWGHIHGNDVDVLEFWGAPGNNYAHLGPDYEGHRVDSFTPEGLAESVKGAEGWSDSFIDGALSATTASGSATTRRAVGACREVKDQSTIDNSDMARAALTFAWASHDMAEGNYGTDLYQAIYKGLQAAGANIGSSEATKDCGVCVASAVLWSGSDDDYCNITSSMDEHMRTCPRWEFVGKLSDLSKEDMQPGDVCVDPSSHVFMYVGSDLVREMRPDADPNCDSVSASLGTRSAGIDNSWDYYKKAKPDAYNVYRCTDPQHSSRFTSIAGGFS